LTGEARRQTIVGTLLPGPLHRVTPLRNDPAGGWLSSGGRFAVAFRGFLAWVGWFVAVRAVWMIVHALLTMPDFDTSAFGATPPRLAAGFTAVTLAPVARYLSIWLRAKKTAARAQADAASVARPIDDLTTLADEPDGSVVSLVGWVNGHGYLLHRAGGHQAVGVTMHCRGQNLVESLHNFDLLDEAGNSALVIAAGARMMGAPNVQLSRAEEEDRNLVHSLDLPAGVAPTYWSAYVLRDGDPVMVIGIKSTVNDPSQLERGRPAARTAVASDKLRPLLVIPLAAERREV
jgi:hypothetical protein